MKSLILRVVFISYSKAKLLMMTKQLNDAADLRQKMEDHIKDLQQQLKNSREENNVHKKK